MFGFSELSSFPPRSIWDGVVARVFSGERLSFGVVELDPNAHVPEHRHEQEQLGIVLAGLITFRIGAETRELGPGGTWSIPSNEPHEATAGHEGAVVIDVFAPVRADWESLEPGEPRAPRWP